MCKKIASLLMSFTLFVTCLAGATISYASDNDCFNNDSETVLINGIEYKYEETFENGEEITHIINLKYGTEDVLYYDKEKNIVFLNEEPFAYVENLLTEVVSTPEYEITPFAVTTGWKYHDTSYKKITWKAGAAASAVAAAISAVIPGTSAKAVIAKMGIAVLNSIANSCVGGKVKCVAYTQVLLDGKVQCRYDWTFITPKGKSYGPYTSYKL